MTKAIFEFLVSKGGISSAAGHPGSELLRREKQAQAPRKRPASDVARAGHASCILPERSTSVFPKRIQPARSCPRRKPSGESRDVLAKSFYLRGGQVLRHSNRRKTTLAAMA